MPSPLYLYDDGVARGWAPFALTRPISELRLGGFTLSGRAGFALQRSVEALLDTGGLLGFQEEGAPPVVPLDDLSVDGQRVVLSSRYLPPFHLEWEGAEGVRLRLDGETVGWVLPPNLPFPPVEVLLSGERWEALPDRAVEGELLPTPWDLMARAPMQVVADLAVLGPSLAPLETASHIHRVGTHPVTVGGAVRVDGPVALDSGEGPIHLEEGVHLHPFTRIVGPSWVGAGSTLLGGVFNHLTCGPVCRLRGEVEASVFLGYANKAHDGYLGHALVGKWVNLGALTTNSDLKNNYGSVRVPTEGGEVDTGLTKVGVFLGDHAKTGIGTLLNTGTVVGAGSNLFGGAMPPKWVPPFSWGVGSELGPFRKEAFLELAQLVMGRRNVSLTPEMRDFLAHGWDRARGEKP